MYIYREMYGYIYAIRAHQLRWEGEVPLEGEYSPRISLQLFQALGRREREHHGRFSDLWLSSPGAPFGTERSSLVEAEPRVFL